MASIPHIRNRLLEGFPEKQADLLAHVVVEAHDELVNRADFHALTGVVTDLAEAQRQTTQQVAELTVAQKRTEQQVTELTVAQREFVETQKRMLIRLDRLDGWAFEHNLSRHLAAYVGRTFRRCRTIDPQELVESLEDRLTEAELDDLGRADIIATARAGEQSVHLIVEVSCTADTDDLERLNRRVASLGAAGLPAVGIVACEAIAPQTLARAQRQGVRVLLAGRLVPDAA